MLRAFLDQPSILVEKKTKKKGGVKTVEIKPHLKDVSVEDADGQAVLTITLPYSNDMTVNPTLLLTALSAFAGAEVTGEACRLELFDRHGAVFA